MGMSLKNRLAVAVGTLSLAWGSVASAAPLANVSGNWSVVANQSVGLLAIVQGAGAPCAPINGTIFGNPVRGFYCPPTGRISFARKNAAGVVIQSYTGNVSDVVVGLPNRLGGTFQALDTAAGSGILGEYHFQGQK